MSKDFLERLRSLRKDQKKADFARFLGIPAPMYHRYEAGQVPKENNLRVIADRCGVTVDWLLGREPLGGFPGAKPGSSDMAGAGGGPTEVRVADITGLTADECEALRQSTPEGVRVTGPDVIRPYAEGLDDVTLFGVIAVAESIVGNSAWAIAKWLLQVLKSAHCEREPQARETVCINGCPFDGLNTARLVQSLVHHACGLDRYQPADEDCGTDKHPLERKQISHVNSVHPLSSPAASPGADALTVELSTLRQECAALKRGQDDLREILISLLAEERRRNAMAVPEREVKAG